jgi:hypothetical protein
MTISLTDEERRLLEALLKLDGERRAEAATPPVPDTPDPDALARAAIAARETLDAEAAIALADQAIAAGNRSMTPRMVKASSLGDLRRYDEALGVIREALADCPANELDGVLHERGFQRLLSGDAGGWADWEHRVQRRQLGENLQKFWPDIREWDGSANRCVLVNAEKGLGDSILFARYLPVLFGRGCTVQFLASNASAPMAAAMRGYRGVCGAYSGEDAIPKLASHWIALESLPLYAQQIPAPFEFAGHWRARDRAGRKLRVGICWHGNLEYSAAQARRPQDLRDWEPVTCLPEVDFVSLQLGEPGPCGSGLPADSTLNETLAAICGCDLVISTDTSVVHMAGTVGCPTWMPLHRLNYWPWIMSADDVGTVWYPSMRIFRQRTAWPPVFEEMAACMERFG